MIKVAIVGNIASGKSQVEKILLDMGYSIVDTDKINHSILENDISAINEIKQTFQNEDILTDNKISREKLGKIVFSNEEKKKQLEAILHKRISEKVDEFFNTNSNKDVVFVAIPLLFETKQENLFDKIIFISASEEIRLKRLIARNNYTEEYAKTRIKSQANEDEKLKKSDYVIYDDSDLISLKTQVEEILSQLI